MAGRVPLRAFPRGDSLCRAWPANVFVQVLDSLLQRRNDSLLLVVGGEHDAEAQFGGFDVTSIGCETGVTGFGGLLLAELALGEPAVVPTWQRSWSGRFVGGGARGDVCLFRGEDGARFRGDEVEAEEELARSQPRFVLFQGIKRATSRAYRDEGEQHEGDEEYEQNVDWCCPDPVCQRHEEARLEAQERIHVGARTGSPWVSAYEKRG